MDSHALNLYLVLQIYCYGIFSFYLLHIYSTALIRHPSTMDEGLFRARASIIKLFLLGGWRGRSYNFIWRSGVIWRYLADAGSAAAARALGRSPTAGALPEVRAESARAVPRALFDLKSSQVKSADRAQVKSSPRALFEQRRRLRQVEVEAVGAERVAQLGVVEHAVAVQAATCRRPSPWGLQCACCAVSRCGMLVLQAT